MSYAQPMQTLTLRAVLTVKSWAVQREEEEEEYEVDDEMALALGFGGFGSSKR